MLDILTALIEALSRFVPAFSTARRDKQLREIGVDLYRVYFGINEVLLVAERIVQRLEAYAESEDRTMSELLWRDMALQCRNSTDSWSHYN